MDLYTKTMSSVVSLARNPPLFSGVAKQGGFLANSKNFAASRRKRALKKAKKKAKFFFGRFAAKKLKKRQKNRPLRGQKRLKNA